MTADPSSGFIEYLNRARNPVYVTDDENRIVAWNDAAERLLGYHSKDVVGKRCYPLIAGTDVYGNDYCSSDCAVMKMVRRNRSVNNFELNLKRACGNRIRVRCGVLVIPGSATHRFIIVHLLEEVNEGTMRASGSIVEFPCEDRRLPLTVREQQVLQMLAKGANTQKIADTLYISPVTVRTHVRNLLMKLDAHTRLEAVSKALEQRLLTNEIAPGPFERTQTKLPPDCGLT